MPIVEHIHLPSFGKLRERGQEVLSLEQALRQDIRELHIGLLNMMPDTALQVTERQFMRLVGNSNQIAQFYVHPFSVSGVERSEDAAAYISQYYSTFEEIRKDGLDALIITGANIVNPSLDQEPFWEPLSEVMEWATAHVTSTLCSCLSTHALMKYFYQIDRQRLAEKKWGVYEHRIVAPYHPLLREINTRFDAPHSRYNEITRQQLEHAGLTILIEGEDCGVHMAVSKDQLRRIYFQGHPEYDTNSLLKEYKREVNRYLDDERAKPPFPENYFSTQVKVRIAEYIEKAKQIVEGGHIPEPFPEAEIEPQLDNTWGDTAKAIFNNWLGLVYRLTNVDRQIQFMDGIDPDNPLGLL